MKQLSHTRLWGELIMLSLIVPSILYNFPPKGVVFLALWCVVLLMVWCMRRGGAWRWKQVFNKAAVRWEHLKPMLLRFALSAALLSIGVAVFEPERLLSLPREKPVLWMVVMVAYPLISVFPQEVIYRSYFFWRFAPILHNPKAMVYVSGLAFGYMHVLFNNWVAVLLSCVGGVLFSHTYARTKSLAMVWIEHALYGCFIFTIGLGWYFYSGAQMR